MGLFETKKDVGTHAPLYNLTAEKSVLVVGLGNIGKEYANTRHNIGFDCVDEFAKQHEFPTWLTKSDLKCAFTKLVVGDTRVLLIKPTTFMNESGQAVHAVQQFFKMTNSQTVVVHDELDIPFGQIRTRQGGGSAGNNGIKSVIQHCGESFGRIRIGIHNDHASLTESSTFVLTKFSKEERSQYPLLTREVSTLISEYLASGSITAQTRNFLI